MTGPIQLFKNSLAIVKANLFLFLSILLIPIVVSFLTALFAPNMATGIMITYEFVIYLFLMVVSIVLNILMTVALILAINDNSISAKMAYNQARQYFWKYIGLSIVMSLLIMVGFVLLIIPGIILSVWFVFSTFILVLENGAIIESLKKSREYVRGKWWAIFGRLIAMSLFILLLGMLISLITVFMPAHAITEAIVSALTVLLAPIAMAYMYLMYTEVKTGPATVTAAPTPASFAPSSMGQ